MNVTTKERTFTPQPGPQTQGMISEADILIMGGGELRSAFFWPACPFKRAQETRS